MNTATIETAMATILRARLLELARHQDELAAAEAAATPYWKPQPATVHGHRAAAAVLRAEADKLFSSVEKVVPTPESTAGRHYPSTPFT